MKPESTTPYRCSVSSSVKSTAWLSKYEMIKYRTLSHEIHHVHSRPSKSYRNRHHMAEADPMEEASAEEASADAARAINEEVEVEEPRSTQSVTRMARRYNATVRRAVRGAPTNCRKTCKLLLRTTTSSQSSLFAANASQRCSRTARSNASTTSGDTS